MLNRLRTLFSTAAPDAPSSGFDEPPSPLQIYAGYEPECAELIERHAVATPSLQTDHYVDGFGVKTRFDCVPFADPQTLNLSRLKRPLPDDGFHAEGIEYCALLDAIERFSPAGEFTVVEAGAGWGPWLAMAGVICKRLNTPSIRLIGLEASPERYALMQEHLAFNQLDEAHGVVVSLFEGAVWGHDGVVHFPVSDVKDMGAAASQTAQETDYRGLQMQSVPVPCTRLPTLVGEGQKVDFLHIDIQGAEGSVVPDHIDWLNASVRSAMIATHSRPLEGQLMDLLNANNWQLIQEKLCRFSPGQPQSDWTAATTVDGSQYWVNVGLG